MPTADGRVSQARLRRKRPPSGGCAAFVCLSRCGESEHLGKQAGALVDVVPIIVGYGVRETTLLGGGKRRE